MNEQLYPRTARFCFIALAWLFAVSVTVQVLIAGVALFVDASSWAAHVSFARYFAFLPIIMAVLAIIVRFPKKLVWRSFGLFGMVIGMFITAILSSRIGILSALHPVIALLLFWSSIEIIRSSGQTK